MIFCYVPNHQVKSMVVTLCHIQDWPRGFWFRCRAVFRFAGIDKELFSGLMKNFPVFIQGCWPRCRPVFRLLSYILGCNKSCWYKCRALFRVAGLDGDLSLGCWPICNAVFRLLSYILGCIKSCSYKCINVGLLVQPQDFLRVTGQDVRLY